MIVRRRDLGMIAALGLAAVGLGAGTARAQALQAVPAPRWSALFDRSAGWTGGDGVYSFHADGWNAPDDPNRFSPTIFTFQDSFIGAVTSHMRDPGFTVVHNSAARLRGLAPVPAAARFVWAYFRGRPAPLVTPATSGSLPGEWYWPIDGVVTGGVFYQFAQRLIAVPNGLPFPYATVGINLLSVSVADLGHPGATPAQTDTPLLQVAVAAGGVEQYGNAVMNNTRPAGSLHGDGYVYVYGLLNNTSTKMLLAARMRPDAVAKFNQWTFWNGAAWVGDITAAVPIMDGLSSGFSMTPLPNGQYALVYQLGDSSSQVAISFGASPVGPFSTPQVIYTCPEPGRDPSGQVYAYDAKAHPGLSAPGHLLISYDVNTLSAAQNLADAAIYHPRFIDLDLHLGGL